METTASHPFRTYRGWKPLAELKVGDHIAVPRRLNVFGNKPARETAEVKLLAYLIGDGGLSDTCPEFTNANPRLRDEFTEAVREFGGLKHAHGRCQRYPHANGSCRQRTDALGRAAHGIR